MAGLRVFESPWFIRSSTRLKPAISQTWLRLRLQTGYTQNCLLGSGKHREQNDWPSQANRFQVLTQFHRTKPSLTLSNRSKRRPLRAHTFFMMSLSCVLLAGCNRTDPQLSFSAHTQTSIPPSAKLVHSGGQYAGVDASYGFVFDVSDTALQEQLVGEWNLQAATASESGFFKFAKHPWWPTDDALLKMDGHFGRSDEQKEEYWHVWHDRPNGKLYVEHGRW